MKVVMYAPAGRIMALATRYAVKTQVASSWLAPRPPAMWGRATLAIEVSSTSMNVARVTVIAIIQGFRLGFQTAVGAEGRVGRASAAAALIPVSQLETDRVKPDA